MPTIPKATARELVEAGARGAIDGIAKPDDPLRNVKLGIFASVLAVGWLFILWSNRFHITAPVVFVCLGFLAIEATVLNLWRTGAAVVAPDSEDGTETWGRPIGAKGELEKEKRTLLKAIKEAEFDFAMGKLSKADVDQLVLGYRARAIEVIKALDHLESGAALDTKAKIEREVRARIQLAASDKPSKRAANATAMKAAQADAKTKRADAKAEAKEAADEAKAEATAKQANGDDTAANAAKADEADANASKADDAQPAAAPQAAARAMPMPGVLQLVLGALSLAAIVNFATGAVLSGALGIALIVGVLAGNNAVRTLLIGLALLAMFQPAWAFVDLSNQHALTGQKIALLAVFGFGEPLFVIWALMRNDVRTWMFRRNFNVDAAGDRS